MQAVAAAVQDTNFDPLNLTQPELRQPRQRLADVTPQQIADTVASTANDWGRLNRTESCCAAGWWIRRGGRTPDADGLVDSAAFIARCTRVPAVGSTSTSAVPKTSGSATAYAERMLFIRCDASLFYVGQVGGTARDPKNVESPLGTGAVARPKHVADLSRRTASTSDSSDNEAEAALSLNKIRVFPE